jgi:hypothetical protein
MSYNPSRRRQHHLRDRQLEPIERRLPSPDPAIDRKRLQYAGDVAEKKNPAAVALGRLGGRKRGPKGFSMLSAEQRKENARKAVLARWRKAGKVL